MDEKLITDFVEGMLDMESLEELLERFDIEPYQAFLVLFKQGLIDEEILREMMRLADDLETFED